LLLLKVSGQLHFGVLVLHVSVMVLSMYINIHNLI